MAGRRQHRAWRPRGEHAPAADRTLGPGALPSGRTGRLLEAAAPPPRPSPTGAGTPWRQGHDDTTDRGGRARPSAELGWQPEYRDFRSGLAATIDWYRTNEDWWRPQKSATEARYATAERVL
ncbi:hypothetical protein ACTHQ1_01940 [Janibacter anophelis]|uniref:hypothetical protein n=1 Tax=Janibacter anophelis TaxID=319054 RepID=UPI003F7F4AE5